METAKIICKNCKVKKTKDNFYWHTERLGNVTLKNPNCKDCISKKNKEKYEEKKELYFQF